MHEFISHTAACKMVDNPSNGQVTVSKGIIPLEGSVINIACYYDYVLQGTNLSMCTHEGLWVPDPNIAICRGEHAVVTSFLMWPILLYNFIH